jgi:glycosyltransferase involved in cell wall biosynthesis
MSSISVVIPVYNEDNNINKLFNFVKQLSLKKSIINELVLVENGSTDNTRMKIKKLSSGTKELDLIKIYVEINQEYGGAVKIGVQQSKNDAVMILPADGKYSINDVIKVITAYENSSDITLMVKGRRNLRNDPLTVQFLSIMLTFLCRLLFSTKVKDINGLPKIFNKKIIGENLLNLSSNSCFDATLCDVWQKSGGKFLEINVSFIQNKKASWKGRRIKVSIAMIFTLLKYKFNVRRGI